MEIGSTYSMQQLIDFDMEYKERYGLEYIFESDGWFYLFQAQDKDVTTIDSTIYKYKYRYKILEDILTWNQNAQYVRK